MSGSSNYKPVGGVSRAVLHFADTLGGAEFSAEGCRIDFEEEGLEVELVDDASTYDERMSVEKGRLLIEHTLHLVARRDAAAPWLDEAFAERLLYDGVVAEVELNDGRHLVVGCSAALYDEQPLRLAGLAVESGAALREQPRVTLDLVARDKALSAIILNET